MKTFLFGLVLPISPLKSTWTSLPNLSLKEISENPELLLSLANTLPSTPLCLSFSQKLLLKIFLSLVFANLFFSVLLFIHLNATIVSTVDSLVVCSAVAFRVAVFLLQQIFSMYGTYHKDETNISHLWIIYQNAIKVCFECLWECRAAIEQNTHKKQCVKYFQNQSLCINLCWCNLVQYCLFCLK